MESIPTLDLTIGLLGHHVPEESSSITWQDGHKSILPAVYNNDHHNVCDEVDIPIIKFMSTLPSSMPNSEHVVHLSSDRLQSDDIMAVVGNALSLHKPVVIRGTDHDALDGPPTAEYLDSKFGISPNCPVQIHGNNLCDNRIISTHCMTLQISRHVQMIM